MSDLRCRLNKEVPKFRNGMNESLFKFEIEGVDSLRIKDDNDKCNEPHIHFAIYSAVRDLTVRTMNKIEGKSTTIIGLAADISSGGLLDKLIKLFDDKNNYNSEENFDNWHNEACENVLETLNEFYNDVAYGKAQKVVNMTFKYLYCFNDSESYKECFKYCHMPLDSFTLEWFCREATKQQTEFQGFRKNRKSKKEEEVVGTIVKGSILSWSNITYMDSNFTSDKKYTYKYIVEKIREIIEESECSDYKGLTPLESEFIIWPEIQLHLAAEGFIFAFMGEGKDDEDTAPITVCDGIDETWSKKTKQSFIKKQSLSYKIGCVEKIINSMK